MEAQWSFVPAPPNLWAKTEKDNHHPVVILAVRSESYSRSMHTKVLLAHTEVAPGGWHEEGTFDLYFKEEE
jgi:hypothetical protein